METGTIKELWVMGGDRLPIAFNVKVGKDRYREFLPKEVIFNEDGSFSVKGHFSTPYEPAVLSSEQKAVLILR
ncbi:MAG: hypothetical protein PHH21_00135 [Candidatus Pacebacteria bacterium]|nr:hypothetical protein [Candidatus Paceibacterota bacterium]